MHKFQGVTFSELLIAMAISAVLVSIAGAPFADAFHQHRLKAASEESYFLLLAARSYALAQGDDIYIDIETGAHWCVGLTDNASCSCSVLNSCTVNGAEKVVSFRQHKKVNLVTTSFRHNQSRVDGLRGMAVGNAGKITFDSAHNSLSVVFSNLARPRICVSKGHVGGYSLC